MLFIKNLHKSYCSGNKSYRVLKGIDLSVAGQEFVAVMGPSGSGKSTLLNCISCYIPFEEGTISLGGQTLKGLNEDALARVRNEKLGFVFQDFMLLNGLTIQENIFLPQIIAGTSQKKMENTTNSLLTMFHIEDIAKKYPAEVSGGQKQRASIARALSNNPSIILADEPTGNLDTKSSAAVIGAFLDAKEKMGAAVLMVTHDAFAASYADQVIALRDGIVFGELLRRGKPKEFLDELLDFTRKVNGDEYDA